jgi:hypothetical protein
LDSFLGACSIQFTQRENFAGDLIWEKGIKVKSISTEQAEGYCNEEAPKGVDGDADPKYESDNAYVSVFVVDNSQSPS